VVDDDFRARLKSLANMAMALLLAMSSRKGARAEE
jgi:hypothetical protein